MKITEYQALAIRTAKQFDTLENNLIHAALGIGSEVGELNETIVSAWMQLPFYVHNIPEEIGDVCWYAALLCHSMGWQFEDMFHDPGVLSDMSAPLAAAVIGRNPPALCMVLGAFAGDIIGIVKSYVIYRKEIDKLMMARKLGCLVSTLGLLSNIHDVPFEEVTLEKNIEKLRERFPDKYSDFAAIQRSDKILLEF